MAAIVGCSEPPGPQPDVLFIVLDNVRADRLAQCGYERPTSPFLDQLCARDLASCSCGAQAPSTWTLPTHASYFTGTEVPQHGTGMGGRTAETVRLAPGTFARPLDDRLPTLAEEFQERGYQTISLSGNPLISPASGLTRGFEVEHHARDFAKLYGERLFRRLEQMLEERDEERPMFLFLNICDAHRPWFGIPPGKHDWLPAREYLSFKQEPGKPNETRRRFVTGEMGAEEREALLERLNDLYDYAVWRADETLGSSLRILRNAGIFEGDFRLVLTSDHGEHLGERSLMGHAGPYLYEEMTRVPVAFFSNEGAKPLPDQMPALNVYDLLLEGEIKRRPLRATAYASDTWPVWYGPEVGDDPSAALWEGSAKTVHHDGEILRYDLSADPLELEPLAWNGEAEVEQLEALLEALAASASSEPPSEEMLELLRSLGYL